ncbi:MAG: glycosyltransferase family 4 protein [Proteobacteria bacterium]|nr:glycosyltransferase family 4 protein [Pseudomonadota bacterium]
MSFTIFYEQEGYSIDLPKLMGRNAAGASFLRGLFRHAKSPDFSCLVRDDEGATAFKALLSATRPDARSGTVTATRLEDLARYGGLFYPGPAISASAHHRLSACNGHDSWALCGITHTTASAGAMDAIAEWVTAPVQSWDAAICTSNAVKKNVEIVLQAQVDSLRERLGITKIVMPLLPVIPLGINTDEFAYSANQRNAARSQLSAGENTLVVLYVGRLSFHAKAHPLAMYQALERAAKEAEKNVVLVECGWHANDYIKDAFSAGAALACPSVKVVTLDGRVASNRDTAWAAADVFCSLSDNIQETFGIVPLEAMAAGLPVIVTDWDGYKDTVRHGVDGFRIPTLAPQAGLAGDLAHRHALGVDSYDMYCGHNSSLVAVHQDALAQALIQLFQSSALRQKMGASGRRRAIEDYDWQAIIPRYEALWEEQTKMRLAARSARLQNIGSGAEPPPAPKWAARLDPTVAFANYPTQLLRPSTQLTLTEPSAEAALSKLADYNSLSMVNYASFVCPTERELKSVLTLAEQHFPNGCAAEELLKDIDPKRQPYVLRGLAWLCKLGLFTFS